MSARQKWLWGTGLGLHLFLILAVSLQDLTSTLREAGNFPPWFEQLLDRTEGVAAAATGRRLAETNRWRHVLIGYADCTGIEVGYSYFAPNIPGNCKLVFELHYPDGQVEYDLPVVGGEAAGYRLSTLLDYLQVIDYLPLRMALVRTLADSTHREHPRADMIRAVVGLAKLPGAAEYRAGRRITYQPLSYYDFHYRPNPPRPGSP